MRNIFKKFVIAFGFILLFTNTVWAEDLIEDSVSPETSNEEIIEIITPPDPDPIPEVLSIFIRNNDEIIYDETLNLPEEGVVNILDNNNESHEINSRSVLAVLKIISESENSPFLISDLQYYSSFNALYLKCLTVNAGVPLCDNWQYVVNSITPSTGIDQTILQTSGSIALYFGTPHKLNLDKNEIEEGQSVIVDALKYNYIDNIWEILSGVSISVTIPNDSDPWNPLIISETSVDENGQALISLEDEGIYIFGIKEDYSFPAYQVVVKKHTSGGGGESPKIFSLSSAINFLTINKNETDLFFDDLYNDWVAIGISSLGSEAENLKEELFNYFKNTNFESSIITDNERHAMALMSLGIDPRTGTSVNYIDKIVSSFDGEQIGDSSLYSDDIFGLIVLSHAGYDKNDQIIQKIISYIISKQELDGSWESVDMTSASIVALSNFKNLSGADEAIEKAEVYLKGKQETNGSFGNVFSTSWAIQALSLNNSFDLEVENAIFYFANQQKEDGGLGEGDILSRVWATAYALPAVSKISWNDILEYFEKEETSENSESEEEETAEEEIVEDIVILEKEEVKEEIDKIIMNYELLITNEKKEENRELITNYGVEITSGNTLTASAADSGSDFDYFWSYIISIINKIKLPFIWLFVHLYI